MKSKGDKTGDKRMSVTVHLQPGMAVLVDAAAARACTTRHDLVRDLLLARIGENAPILACLARLIGIDHRLERADMLDEELRSEILATMRDLIVATRAEIGE
jgi:hypothetical protein